MDEKWLNKRKYTPGSPIDLNASVEVRRDENGDLHPVLVVSWKAKDDGG